MSVIFSNRHTPVDLLCTVTSSVFVLRSRCSSTVLFSPVDGTHLRTSNQDNVRLP